MGILLVANVHHEETTMKGACAVYTTTNGASKNEILVDRLVAEGQLTWARLADTKEVGLNAAPLLMHWLLKVLGRFSRIVRSRRIVLRILSQPSPSILPVSPCSPTNRLSTTLQFPSTQCKSVFWSVRQWHSIFVINAVPRARRSFHHSIVIFEISLVLTGEADGKQLYCKPVKIEKGQALVLVLSWTSIKRFGIGKNRSESYLYHPMIYSLTIGKVVGASSGPTCYALSWLIKVLFQDFSLHAHWKYL